MKNIFITGFLLSALVCVTVVDAQLYKGVDAEGKVVYSDRPFAAAEKFTPPPISVMDAAKANVDVKTVEEKKLPSLNTSALTSFHQRVIKPFEMNRM